MQQTRHVRWSLGVTAAFVAIGLWLEAMFGLRAAGWVDDPLRREFLRLGHAHGALLGMLNLCLAWAMVRLTTPEAWAARVRLAALCGAVLVGAGFFGGGLWHAAEDPGPLVLAVPAGAMMLIASLVAVALLRPRPPDQSSPGSAS
jgi:hypothetical protein